MEIHHTEGSFETRDGVTLFEQTWRPSGEAKAAVVIVHGYAEHSGRYAHVAERLVRSSYAVHAYDLRGHGRSDGLKGLIRSISTLVNDTDEFIKRAGEQEPGIPLFLLGHSTGGGIAALLAIDGRLAVRGMVLTGALIRLADDVPAPLQWVAAILGALVPRLPVKGLDSGVISRDPEVVAAYDNDPLVYRGRTMARTAAELMGACKRIQARMEAVTLPILVMHGAADALIDPEGSVELHARAASDDKMLKLYDGAYHEIMNEPKKAQVLTDVVQWMDARI
jgi:alpha-beta hydrolase superfamily lysophospholipase